MNTIGVQDILMLARQESAKLHHYFIGVEHLFVALTQLSGGLTVAVLEHHGISPRFVRYSLRESVGRYEDRRFWPGFVDTPRTTTVLGLMKRYAGLHAPAERDLLLAILDEGDSVVIRVLDEMGADAKELRRTAANWNLPLQPLVPQVPVVGDVALNAEQRLVLELMFRDYAQIQVVRELAGGYSGAYVLLIRPIRVGGYKDAPVVVKLDDRQSVLYERRRYDLHVKDTLPATTARLVDMPVVPDHAALGGLKYTFVGKAEDTEPVSLREFAMQRDPQALSDLIRNLFEVFGPAWWLQRKPYRFGVWREYEHVLPPALVIDVLPEEKEHSSEAKHLRPLGAWSRGSGVLAGEVVVLEGFAVQKVDRERGVLHLAAGSQPEAVNRTSKVEVRGMALESGDYYRGQIMDRIVGRVASTRDDLLLRSVQRLEPEFDLRNTRIPAQHEIVGDLPNPLAGVNKLLERQVSGFVSTIHGDLHLGNILVGPRGDAWLIDFAWTREGHTLFDWAMLEASLLVEVVARLAPPGWVGAWGTIGLIRSINQGDDRVFRERHQAARALAVVATVRDLARQCLGGADRWDEYHIALAILTLRMIGWQSEGIDARRLAFLVSALSMAEVQQRRGHSSDSDKSWAGTSTDVDQTELHVDE